MDRKREKEAARMAKQAVVFESDQGVFQLGTLKLSPAFAKAADDLAETGKSLAKSMQGLFDILSKADWTPVLKVFSEIAAQGQRAELVGESGWLPHHTTPFDQLAFDEDERPDAAQVNALVASYYRDNWEVAAAKFRARLEGYEIDEEAKATFIEALAIHGAGHYRAAPRLLFPEIERVASDEFFEGKRRPTVQTDGGNMQAVLITGLKEVRKSMRRLSAGDFFAFEYGWQLFTKLEEHLYEKVGDDPIVRAKFAADPVPNRHAAIHGIIPYRDMKTSLNAIIMTDFLFHMMSRLKKRVRDSDAATAAAEAAGG